MMDALRQRPLRWESLTWEEIAACRESGMDLCLFPAGATEQHGPHLGTGMDSRLAVLLCEEVSRETGTPVLPTLSYGCSLGHSHHWPGTLALLPQTLTDLVVQIFEWIHQAGFKRLIIVNGHVGNFAPLRCALELIRSQHDDAMVRICNVAEISPRVRADFYADAQDWHANAAETSLMMAEGPELVRAGKVAQADDEDRTGGMVFSHPVNRTSKNGVTGFPSRATSEQGKALFRIMVQDLTEIVRRGLSERPPLDQSYFSPIQ